MLVAVLAGLNIYLGMEVAQLRKAKAGFKVIEVLDGDSFLIPPGQTIRLANLDAPEIGLCFGQEAKEKLEGLILGQYVEIEKVGRDSFGRTIGLVYLNGQLVNTIAAENGWAKYASGGTEAKEVAELIKQRAKETKKKQLGVWSEKCYQKVNPINPKCNIKGNIGKHDRVKIYHLPGCSEYERAVVELSFGEKWFCTEKEAIKAGYQKSRHCF